MRKLRLVPAILGLSLAALGVPAQAASPDFDIGFRHTCAVDSRGEVACWGDNFFGQLGNGEIEGERRIFVEGTGAATAVAAASFTTCALTAAGGVKCWGRNRNGALGDGRTDIEFRSAPADVAGLTAGVSSVAVGGDFACALTTGGGVKCWGRAASIGSPGTGSAVPRDVEGLSAGVRAIAAGNSEACAITAAGGVKCWGQFNDRGQLGIGTTTPMGPGVAAPVPVDVVGLASGVTAIAVGFQHSCAVLANGTVRCWGENSGGAAGDASGMNRLVPGEVAGVSGAVAVAAGQGFSCALTSAGGVKCWGSGPARGDVPGLTSGITAISAGPSQLCATHADGGLSCVGFFTFQFQATEARRIPNLATPVRGVALGQEHGCAVDGQARVVCWGANTVGQLGVAYTPPRISVRVAGLNGAAAIATGDQHSCALLESGAVKCWGDNSLGQLGDGTTTPRGTPVDVIGLPSGARAIAASGTYTCVLLTGAIRCWGLGGERHTISVVGVDMVSIAVGEGFGCFLTSGGAVRCWGDNTYGQLGNGTLLPSPGLASVVGLGSGVRAIAAGIAHACALLANGSLRCWGHNSGALGIAPGSPRPEPVDVPAFAAGARAVFARQATTCALTEAGAAWCWGQPSGANFTPRPMAALQSGAVAVRSVLHSHTCAFYPGGAVNCFGSNAVGQLGDGTRALARGKPESVVAPDGASFLDLTPEDPIGPEAASRFLAVTRDAGAGVEAEVRARAEDVGRPASHFVFAMAPASQVQPARDGSEPFVVGKAVGAGGEKNLLQCVLAQLSSSGQLVAVTPANLQAYITGVLSGQGQAVSIVNNVGLASIAGATFFVGYGSSASGMLTSGTNRGVVSVPGATQCRPEPPQTGWWWNPAEDGRGYSIERRGNNLFFAAFLYDVSGRSTWHVSSGPVSLDGSLYMGDLLSARGGQTLGGAYPGFPQLRSEGPMSLAFNTAASGTLVWPGGAVPIQRFNIVPNGLAMAPMANIPESGWWWNEQESGRGFFLEWQGNTLDIAGYMYDEAGNPVWYLTVGTQSADGRSFSGNWWSYGNGMTLMGPWRPHTRLSDNVAPVTITFSGPDAAIMTLPNNRTTTLRRHRF